MNTIKCVVLGDAAVGKTSLLVSYATNQFPHDYEPTVYQSFAVTVLIGKRPYTLSLFDTAGRDEYANLRSLSCPHTNVYLVCFSVISLESLKNVMEKWIPYLRENCPHTPFYLVGTKTDLRDDPELVIDSHEQFVSPQRGRRMAKRLKAVGYIECSALTQKGVHTLFNNAIMTVLSPPKPRKTKFCCLRLS